VYEEDAVKVRCSKKTMFASVPDTTGVILAEIASSPWTALANPVIGSDCFHPISASQAA
jgi:hypothetical protein